jgi:hypothetical protein
VEHGIRLLPPGNSPRVLTGHIVFYRSEMAPCTFLITSPMRARTNRSRDLHFTR